MTISCSSSGSAVALVWYFVLRLGATRVLGRAAGRARTGRDDDRRRASPRRARERAALHLAAMLARSRGRRPGVVRGRAGAVAAGPGAGRRRVPRVPRASAADGRSTRRAQRLPADVPADRARAPRALGARRAARGGRAAATPACIVVGSSTGGAFGQVTLGSVSSTGCCTARRSRWPSRRAGSGASPDARVRRVDGGVRRDARGPRTW